MTPSLHQNLSLIALLPVLGLAYLFGGASTEGLELRLITNGLSAILLALLLIAAPRAHLDAVPRPLAVFFVVLFVILGLQLLPLPPTLWTSLFMRETVIAELNYFEQDLPWLSLSLAPAKTMITITELMPVLLAAFVAAFLDQKRFLGLVGALLLVSLLSALWGLLQVLSPSGFGDYIWEVTSRGLPAGAYANVNHQATHMLIALPLLALWVISMRRFSRWPEALITLLGAAAFLIFFIGLVAAGSVAGYLLGAVAVPATRWIYARRGRGSGPLSRSQVLMSLIGAVGLAAVILIIFTSPQLSGLGVTSFENTPLSRAGMNELSLTILADHWLWGTGAGSFAEIFAAYEAPALVTSKYANHAHNDYLELLIEYGVLPLALLAGLGLFALWRGLRSHQTTGRRGRSVSRNALLLVLLVAALHSLVDYPSRSQFLLIAVTICAARLCRTSDSNQLGDDY